MDNYGTHKVAKVRTWLGRHPRYHVHYTPTTGSWLNPVERLFAQVTKRCVVAGATPAFDLWRKPCLPTWTSEMKILSRSYGLPTPI